MIFLIFSDICTCIKRGAILRTFSNYLVIPLVGIRQERPPHLRQELVHPAMKERGRAISTPTVPITDRPHNPPPIIVEGRVSGLDDGAIVDIND